MIKTDNIKFPIATNRTQIGNLKCKLQAMIADGTIHIKMTNKKLLDSDIINLVCDSVSRFVDLKQTLIWVLMYQPIAYNADKSIHNVSRAQITFHCRTVFFAHAQNLLLHKFYYYGLFFFPDLNLLVFKV